MGCCSSRSTATVDDGSAKYTELGAQSLQSAGSQIQVHACAAGYFRHVTVKQLISMDVCDAYILAAIGDARDAAALSAQMQPLQQVFRESLSASVGQVCEALKDTCQHITSRVPGSALAILHTDQRTLKLHMACCGGANAVIGELVHGLAAQVAEAHLLCPVTQPDIPEQGGAQAAALPGAAQDRATLSEPREGSAAEQAPPQIVERQLLPVHEHIIVGLPGFWAVASPDAAALRAHFYLRGMSGQDGFGREVQAPCQTAGHLARFAECQARHAAPTIGTLVITLRWPSSSVNQAFRDQGLMQALRGGSNTGAAGAEERSSQCARRHWRLVQSLYVEYVRAHRRVVQGKWKRVIKQAVAEGLKRAHKLEQEIWLRDNLVVSVSPSLKISNQKGQEISIAARSSGLNM